MRNKKFKKNILNSHTTTSTRHGFRILKEYYKNRIDINELIEITFIHLKHALSIRYPFKLIFFVQNGNLRILDILWVHCHSCGRQWMTFSDINHIPFLFILWITCWRKLNTILLLAFYFENQVLNTLWKPIKIRNDSDRNYSCKKNLKYKAFSWCQSVEKVHPQKNWQRIKAWSVVVFYFNWLLNICHLSFLLNIFWLAFLY